MQTLPAHRCRRSALGAAVLGLAATPCWAQDGGSGLRVTPLFSASETYAETRSSPTIPSGAEYVTRLSPGIQLSSRSGRIQGSLNYSLNALFRSGGAVSREVQNSLDAAFTAEAVPRWLFVDGNATVSQQPLSAYGLQALPDSTLANANRAEVGTASLVPRVRGRLGPAVNYEARLNLGVNEVKGTSDNDTTTTGGAVSLSSATGVRLGWGLDLSQQDVKFKLGSKTSNQRANASLSYAPAYDVRLAVNGGRESADGVAAGRQTQDTWGAGITWTPTERTSARLQSDQRYFGRSHSLSFSHRMPRSSISYTDTRDRTQGGDPRGVGQPLTLYQQLYAQFASAQPDPALREQAVLDYLQQNGLDPYRVQQGGLLTTTLSLQRRRDLSVAWTGLRTSLSLQGFASDTRAIDGTGGEAGTRLYGYSAKASYRLTPLTSLTLDGSRQATLASGDLPGNSLKSLALGWSTQPGRRVTTSLQARYAVFNSATEPYRETSVTAALNLRF